MTDLRMLGDIANGVSMLQVAWRPLS